MCLILPHSQTHTFQQHTDALRRLRLRALDLAGEFERADDAHVAAAASTRRAARRAFCRLLNRVHRPGSTLILIVFFIFILIVSFIFIFIVFFIFVFAVIVVVVNVIERWLCRSR
jgi:hypothetical protein